MDDYVRGKVNAKVKIEAKSGAKIEAAGRVTGKGLGVKDVINSVPAGLVEHGNDNYNITGRL